MAGLFGLKDEGEPEDAGEEWFAAAELSFGAMVRGGEIASVPNCFCILACRGFVDWSSKSSLERKINHERVHLQLQLDSSGGAYPLSNKGRAVCGVTASRKDTGR